LTTNEYLLHIIGLETVFGYCAILGANHKEMILFGSVSILMKARVLAHTAAATAVFDSEEPSMVTGSSSEPV
jgi:hypothetical protein